MEIDFEYYKLFYNVAKCGSFSKAAEQLYITQPAITQAIKKLEENLGGTLFYRNNKGISLTTEGKNLYNFIESSIETLENAQKRFEQYRNLERGTIKIKGSISAMEEILKKPIIKFIENYPNINIDILNGGHKDSLRELSEGKVDMAILNLPINYEYKNIQIIEVKRNDLIFVMSRKYQEQNNVKIDTITDLEKYALIVPRKGTKYREVLDGIFEEERKYKYEVMSVDFQKELLKENLGIAFLLKDKVKDELEAGELIEIKINDKNASILSGVGVLKNDAMNFATKKLVEYIEAEAKSI